MTLFFNLFVNVASTVSIHNSNILLMLGVTKP